MGRKCRDTKRNRHCPKWLRAKSQIHRLDRLANDLRSCHGLPNAGTVQQDDEFFPTVPAGQIALADIGAHDLCDALQNEITGIMTEVVVKLLEMVSVTHDQAD